MYMWCLFYTDDTYNLFPRVPYLYRHSYLIAASLGQRKIIGLLVIQYEMFWDINILFWIWSTAIIWYLIV